jgi:hypothetical protein
VGNPDRRPVLSDVTFQDLSIPAIAATILLGCSNNTDEQRAAAQAAADAYCDCAAETAARDPAELATQLELCKPEEAKWHAAWEGLPDRANGDDTALAISNYQAGCYGLVHDAWGNARISLPD